MPKKTTRVATLLTIFGFAMLAAGFLLRPSSAQSPADNSPNSTERTVETKIPKEVPIKFKLKGDKERRIKSMANQEWTRDVQFELTNMSTKPIYYVAIFVRLPDVLNPEGISFALPVRYGRVEFIDAGTLPTKEDKPIPPGETVTIKLSNEYVQAWDARVAAGVVKQPRKLEFKFIHLSFGDGTGFYATGQAFPSQRTSNNCREPDRLVVSIYAINIPAIVPVSFFLPIISELALTTNSPDVCLKTCKKTTCKKIDTLFARSVD